MTAVTVQSTVTQIVPAGKYGFIYIYNNSNQTVYLQFDGSDAISSPVALTTSNGFPLLPNQAIIFENRIGPSFNSSISQPLYGNKINGIVASSTADVRVQTAN